MISTKKQKYLLFLGLSLIISIGAIVGYQMWAVSSFDLLDGSIEISTVRKVERINPTSNYEKAIDISTKMYPSGGAPAVVFGPNDAAESVQSSLIASAHNAPLLYINSSLSSTLSNEVARLKPQKIYVVATYGSIGSTVDSAIKAKFPSIPFERISGTDKFDLSRKVGVKLVALNGGSLADRTIMVTNSTEEYVGVMGYYAGIKKYPILYVGNSIPSATQAFINTYKPTRTLGVGGTGSLPDTTLKSLPGPYRIGGSSRFEVAINLYKHASGNIQKKHVALVSDEGLAAGVLAGPYMAKLKSGTLLEGYQTSSTTYNYVKYLASTYGLEKISVVSDDLRLRNDSVLKYANILGAGYPSSQIRMQELVDNRIKMCPILSNSLVEYGNARGYQAVAYYKTGKIVVSPNHTAPIATILNHEVYHIVDWRDNGKIDWGENVPRTNPNCIP